MPVRVDISGQRFGRLVALRKAPSQKRCSHWWMRCDCGAEVSIATQSLRSGLSKSCGCYQRECAAQRGTESRTHGMRHSAEYSVFCGMKRRCENPNEKAFARYGALGVEFRFTSFEQFFSEVGPRPSTKHQIDRRDPFGHYEPGNVRWTTIKRQARNKRNTKWVEIDGTRKCLADWCEQYGRDYRLVWFRIRSGWSAKRALSTPSKKNHPDHHTTTLGGLFV